MSMATTVKGLHERFQMAVGNALYENAGLYGQYYGAKELGDEASMAIVMDRAKKLWEPFRPFVGPCQVCNSTRIIKFEEPQEFWCPVCRTDSP